MRFIHIRILDSILPSLPPSHYVVQLHIHRRTRIFGILKSVTDPGIFFPCLRSYNGQRRTLLKSVSIIADESILSWCPKTSKLGVIPNISYEPFKPVPLGTMFKNGVVCISGVLEFQYVVQDPEKQQDKYYFGENVFLISDNTIPTHTS